MEDPSVLIAEARALTTTPLISETEWTVRMIKTVHALCDALEDSTGGSAGTGAGNHPDLAPSGSDSQRPAQPPVEVLSRDDMRALVREELAAIASIATQALVMEDRGTAALACAKLRVAVDVRAKELQLGVEP